MAISKLLFIFFFFFFFFVEKEREHSPTKMKHFVLNKLEEVLDQIRVVIENTKLDSFIP